MRTGSTGAAGVTAAEKALRIDRSVYVAMPLGATFVQYSRLYLGVSE